MARETYSIGRYQATVHRTALGDIRRSISVTGPNVYVVGPQECGHHLTPGEARGAAAALLEVASEVEAEAAG
jgi:hypothetical protein